MSKIFQFLLLTAFTVSFSDSLLANWTMNLGYHNPPGATVGLNLLYYGRPLAVEVGLGYVDAGSRDAAEVEESNSDNADSTTTSTTEEEETLELKASGAINVKYFLSGSGVRPYVQVGVGAGLGVKAGDQSDFGAGVGGLYGGLGLFFGGPGLYAYASYNLGRSSNGFGQFGIGFDI